MVLCVHDNVLVSYEVQCEERRIVLKTEFRTGQPFEFTNVEFEGVEGYRFEGDAFGNILHGVERVPLQAFVALHQGQLWEAHRQSGALGPWAANVDAALAHLASRDVGAFEVSSSVGMWGWVLARSMRLVAVASSSP